MVLMLIFSNLLVITGNQSVALAIAHRVSELLNMFKNVTDCTRQMKDCKTADRERECFQLQVHNVCVTEMLGL